MRWSFLARPAKAQGKTHRDTPRRPRFDRRRAALYLENLEDRTLLSVVHWINTAGGDWHTAANWDAGRVPAAADDVVLDAAGNVTITHASGNDTVRSVQGSDALVISGGSLTLTAGASQISGAFTVGQATVTANGAGTSLTATGAATINGANLYATGGATFSLPMATSYAGASYNTTLQASDPGSKLDLSHLTTLKGGGYYSNLSVRAQGGGVVDLSGVTSNPAGQTSVLADGAGSVVDLSQLPKMVSDAYSNSSLEARNGGTIKDPLLTTLNRTDVTINAGSTLATHQITTLTSATITDNGATPDFSGLTGIDGLSLVVSGGGALALATTSYTGATYNTTFQASDPNSKLDLSHLTTLKGGGTYTGLSVKALNGGLVNLSGVTSNPGGQTIVLADGTGSVVDLSQLPKMVSDAYNNSSLEARNNGTIKDPLLATLNRTDITVNATGTLATHQITTLTGATITDNGATPDFSGLTTIDGLSLVVNGGTLALAATSYTGASYSTTFQASGANSTLDLSHLTKLTGGGFYTALSVKAQGGGLVNLSGVTNNPGGQTIVLADGANSVVDLSQLPKMVSDAYSDSSLEARNNGTIKDPLLTTLNRTDITVNAVGTLATRQITTLTGGTITDNGATPDFSGLTTIDGLSLFVSGGGTLALTATSYTGASYGTTFQASDPNSKLDLSHLTKLTGGGFYTSLSVKALNGGLVNLSGVTNNPGGQTIVLADGMGSVVDLSQLPKMVSDAYSDSSLETRNNGTIKVPLLTTLSRTDIIVHASGTLNTHQITTFTGSSLTDNGTAPDFASLTSADGSSFSVNSGGVLALPALATHSGSSSNSTFQASDANSKLDLSHLTTLHGASSYGNLTIKALAAGRVDLSGVTNNSGGTVNVIADGTGSVVDLSQLPRLASDAYFFSSLEAHPGAAILTPKLTGISRVDLKITGSGSVDTHLLSNADGASLWVNGGGTLALPALTSYTGGAGFNTTFQASDANSVLDLSALATLKGASSYGSLAVQAQGGGRVNLSGVTSNPSGTVNVVADGTGSVVDLSQLPRMASDAYFFSSLEAHPGASILTPKLASISRVDLKITGTGSVDTHLLSNTDGASLWVNGGGTLALPALAGYVGGTGFNTTFQASDANSVLDLSHLTSLKGAASYASLTVQAQAKGHVNLSNVTTNPGGSIAVVADGAGSVVDLSKLTHLASDAPFNSSLTAHNSGTIQLTTGQITLGRTDLDPNGGAISAGTLELAAGSDVKTTGTLMATVLNSGGLVEPAGSPGILQVTGDYTQTVNGSLTTDIGGPGSGQFGRFAVTGTATLGGTLNINLTNHYSPANGVGFQILTAGTLASQFATINGLTQNGRRTFQITYRPTNFALVTVLDDLYPDLQVSGLDTNPSSGLHSGSNLTINWNDVNTGKAATPTGANWYDRVLIKNLTTGQTLVNNVVLYDATARGPIAVNGSQPQQYAYTLPNGMAGAGQIEIDLTVNTFHDVFEFNDNGDAETNNTTTVTKTSVLLVTSADLRVINLGTTFAGPTQSGASVTVRWADANQGNAATSGSFYDTVVVTNTTTNKVIAQASLLYDPSASGNGPIAAGDQRSRQATLRLPDGPDSVGTLAFTVTTDAFNQINETDHSHNTASVTAAVTLAPYPDLQVNNLRLTPATGLQSGTSLVIAWDDANAGNGATPAGWADAITVTNRTTGQTLLATNLPYDATANGAIPAGSSRSRQYAFTLPDGPAGVGTIDFIVTADASNSFFEYHAGGPNPNKQMTVTQAASLAPYADLTVTRLQPPATVLAGRSVPLSWTVANQGNGPAQGNWTDQVFLSADQRTDDGLLVASFTYSGPLAAGQSIMRSEMIPIPGTGLTGTYWFYVRTNGDQGVFELNQNNNTLLAGQATTVQASLTVTLKAASVNKDAGSLPATVSRNGNLAAPLTVNLASSITSQATVPATVTIPAGLASVSFMVTVIQDGLVDGNQNVNITAAATGLQGDMRTLQVIDINKPTLTVALSAGQIKEGDPSPATTGTVTRNTPTTQPLVVTLSTNDPVRLVLPATVTIPAGQASATFPVSAQRDFLIEGPQTEMIQATAGGFINAAVPLAVVDVDVPQLGLMLAATNVLKNATNPATFGVVSQAAAAPHDLTVQLVSSDPGKIMVPGQVVILAGQTTATFPISVVDNHIADGTQMETITAYVTTTTANIQLTQGSAVAHINLLDYHQPSLQLALARDVAAPSSTVTATLSRAQATAQALTVNLASDNPAAATVPATVTIPANQTSVMFPVTAVAKAAQPVNIGATATGLNPGSAQLVVTDQQLPDLKVTSVAIPPTGLTLDQVTVNFRVDNLGLAAAFGTWTDQVYISPTGQAKDGTLLGTFPFTADPMLGLPVGLYYQKALPFQLPSVPGAYWIIVTTNAGHTLTEALTGNNTTVSAQPIQVTPAYTATVHASLRMGVAGQPVTFTGTATKAGGSAPAPFVPVTVRVQLRGTRRVVTALTDASGNFSVVYRPLPGEGGHYQIGAAYPQDLVDPVQDQFTLVGMTADPAQPSVTLTAGGMANGSLSLNNLTEVPLTGIAASVLGAPTDLNVQVNVGTTLPGSGALPVTFTAKSLDNNAFQGTIYLHFASTEGATLDVPVQVTVNRLAPSLTANQNPAVAGVLRGGEAVVSVTVTNQGSAATGDLSVLVSQLSWLTLSSPATIAALNPGQAATVTLTLLPPAATPLGNYSGNIVLRNSTTNFILPFTFRTLSDATGNLTITTVDEYTFYAAGSPNLAGAHVTLFDALSNAVIAQGTTDAMGHLTIPQIREGYYTLDIQADKHFGYHQSVLVQAGSDNPVQAFLARQTVQYSWTVVPTQIQDQTTVQIQATFETNVPIPVVTIDPPLIDLSHMQVGETMQVDLTVTNHGLIAANEGQLHLGNDPRYRFTALITDIGTIPAMSSLTVPLLIQRIGNGPQGQDGGCGTSITLSWTLICGNSKESYSTSVTLVVTPQSCGGPGGGGGGGGGGAIYVSGATSVAPCNPCGLKIAQAILSALFWDLLGRIPRGIGDAIAVAHDLTGLADNVRQQLGNPNPDLSKIEIGIASTVVDIAKATGKELPWVGEALELLDLGNEIFHILQECQQEGGSPGAQDDGLPPDAEALLTKEMTRVQTVLDGFSAFFGDVIWLRGMQSPNFQAWMTAFLNKAQDANGNARPISDADRALLLQMPLPSPVAAGDVNKFLDRWNRTLQYWSMGITQTTQVPHGQSTDFVAVDDLSTKSAAAAAALQASAADGFPQIVDGMANAIKGIYDNFTQKNGGVCARVRLEIDQQAVLTRDAFNATLAIADNENNPLTNVKIDVHVFDSQGKDVTNLFGILPPQLSNLTAVDGTGQIVAGATGQASWLLVPSVNAAPDQPTPYFVSATLSYSDMGVPIVVPMDRTQITVYPQAQLTLNYFFQRDVFGPDPFSDTLFPSEPFSLGVIVSNTGKGTAQNVSITSAQPRIVDNQKGLLVNFNLLASEVNGTSLSPGLTVDFGNIAPGKTAVGRWLFTSSLAGHFQGYTATFQHTDALGGQQLSLIQNVAIHELIHVVHMTMSGLPDFLVDDQPSSLHLPDTLYFGNGTVAPVSDTGLGHVDAPVSTSHLQVQLTATMAAGYAYLQIPDPGNGNFHLVRVVRSDGTEIAVNDNIWETDLTFPDGGLKPVPENLLHLLDYNSTGSYTLYYAPNDPSLPQVASIDPVVPNPRSTAVNSIDVTFSKPIDPATFDYRALTLSRNGGANLITNAVTVQLISGAHYRINGLAGLTGAEGSYVLTVSAAGIKDPLGISGTGSLSVSWTTAIQAPTIASITGVIAGQRNTPVPSITVEFTKPINGITVDYHVLTLTHNGGANLITSAVTVTQVDFTHFRFDGLTALTATDGHYVLIVDASKVKDATGVTGAGTVTIAWDLSTAVPTVTAVSAPSGTVNQTVDTIDVTFSEAIDPTTFTTAALSLTLGGGANLITPAVTIQALSSTVYRIGGLTGLNNVAGTYVFMVSAAAVRDLAGNLGTGSVSATWTLTTAAPPAATNIVLTPHFGMPPNDNITNTLTPMIAGQLGATGLTVGLFDLTTNTDLGQAMVNGMAFSKTLTFTAAGNHTLRLRVSNAGGNSTDSTYTLLIDVTPPTVSRLVNVPAGSTTRSVASIDVVFSKPIQASTFDPSHLSLTLGGGANLVSSAVTITFVSGTTYRINGLAGLTQAKGTYRLTVNLAGIQDLYGNVAGGTATATWTNVLTAAPLVVPMTEGRSFSGTVATLSDGDANTQAGVYTVQIAWGDGTTTTGSVQATTADNFNLMGSHTYAEEGNYAITVTVHDQAGNTVMAASAAAVNDALLTGTGMAVAAREGAAFSSLVATVSDTGGNEPEANYSATINWGDNTTPADATVHLVGGTFNVTGGHTYTEEGTYTVTVVIHEEGGSTVTTIAQATVADADLHATATDQAAAENQALTNVVVASFTDDDPAGTLADYTATISWGDGSMATAGTISLNSQTMRYEVQASHTYADDGNYTITVTLHDMGGAMTTATSTAHISDPAVVGTGNFSLTAVEGADSSMQTVATFTDPAGAEAVGDYTAVIAWGDNATSNGTITYDMTSHVFTVQASHTYAEEGAYNVTVTLKHDTAPDATVTDHATVADPALVGTGGFTATAVEGSDSGMQTVATFTDPGGAEAVSDYTATINWGDGSMTTNGTITYDMASHTFTVKASHTYAEEGGDTVSVTLQHDAAPDMTVTSHATVSDAAVVLTVATLIAVEGADSGMQTVATFTDPGGPEGLADYSAMIVWGDGSMATSGTITYDSTSHVFTVQGRHTYAEEGTYAVGVTVTHDTAPDASVTSTATVADAALHAHAKAVHITEGSALRRTLVATFTDDDPNATAGLFTATIGWGDGSSGPAKVRRIDKRGNFQVIGDHTYLSAGTYPIAVDITDQGGSTAEVMSTATVADAALHASGQSIQAVSGQAFQGLLAMFTDDDPNATAALFSATIAWGDGGTDQVMVQADPNGGFDVLGSHTYAQKGTYTLTIDITDQGGSTAEVTAQARVHNAGVQAIPLHGGQSGAADLALAAQHRRLTDDLFSNDDWLTSW